MIRFQIPGLKFKEIFDMKKILFTGLFLCIYSLYSVEVPGVPRDSNFNNTAGYDGTRIEAQLLVNVKDDTNTIHFIRDNNDPRVVTKTYVLKNTDPYQFRDYIRQIVQSKRVGNTSMQQQYPANTASAPYTATTSSTMLNPATSQPGYTPQVQLGSNTAVECLKYADGTGLLMVSAEEYRFKDSPNGIGIDTLVEMLDNPALGDLNYGYQMFLYMPKFVPARNLMPLIENSGMNINDVTELWQGQDIVAYDSGLNWLAFDVTNYSCANIAAMLAKFDVPIPQVRLKIKVYELTTENDDRIGIDFQNWKNNAGTDFFSIGGRYRNNWAATYAPLSVLPDRSIGSERTGFFNFNPRWNTRYIDLLASKGKAKVVHSGEICIRNAYSGSFSRYTQLIFINSGDAVANAQNPAQGATDFGVGAYQLLSDIVGRVLRQDIPVAKGQQQKTTVSTAKFGFNMQVNNVVVGTEETLFDITLSNTSLLGFQSDGTPRISAGNTVSQIVTLPHGRDTFVIGGLVKHAVVTSTTGIPYLVDIPWIGKYLFGTTSKSVKQTQLVVVGQCINDTLSDKPHLKKTTKPETRGKDYTQTAKAN
jgi:type II secretory pathway component GspD/PulD (secretin)